MADAAEAPEDDVEETGCGLVMDSPAVGSDLPGGQMDLLFFLRVPQPSTVPFDDAEELEMVELEVDDVAELRDVAEFVRCVPFLGPDMKGLPPSSWLIMPRLFSPGL